MPGGQASKKANTPNAKPNTNAPDSQDTAAARHFDPQEALETEGFDAVRAQEAPKNEVATERPPSQA